jgi:hypothetical protein
MTSPVDGLIVGKVFPEVASTHLLLIKSLVAEISTFGSITVVAVAMVFLLAGVSRSLYLLPHGRKIPILPITFSNSPAVPSGLSLGSAPVAQAFRPAAFSWVCLVL